MAERAPLLSRAERFGYDPPIFVRVCHSQWPFLGQRGLALIRAILAVYMTAALATGIAHDWKDPSKGPLLVFDARVISFTLQAVYYWITATWAIQHLLGPLTPLPPEEQAKGRYLARLQIALSMPSSSDVNSTRCTAFALFYTAVVTFPIVVTVASWSFLHPFDCGSSPPFWPRSLVLFVVVNIHIVNSVVAITEAIALSSVRKQKPLRIPSTIIGLCLLYLIWVFVGYMVTGRYVYRFFNPADVGRRGLSAACMYVISLSVFVYLAVQELHGWRDSLVRKAECKRQVR